MQLIIKRLRTSQRTLALQSTVKSKKTTLPIACSIVADEVMLFCVKANLDHCKTLCRGKVKCMGNQMQLIFKRNTSIIKYSLLAIYSYSNIVHSLLQSVQSNQEANIESHSSVVNKIDTVLQLSWISRPATFALYFEFVILLNKVNID